MQSSANLPKYSPHYENPYEATRVSNQQLSLLQCQIIGRSLIDLSDYVTKSDASSSRQTGFVSTDYNQWFELVDSSCHLDSPECINERHDPSVRFHCIRHSYLVFNIVESFVCVLWNFKERILDELHLLLFYLLAG